MDGRRGLIMGYPCDLLLGYALSIWHGYSHFMSLILELQALLTRSFALQIQSLASRAYWLFMIALSRYQRQLVRKRAPRLPSSSTCDRTHNLVQERQAFPKSRSSVDTRFLSVLNSRCENVRTSQQERTRSEHFCLATRHARDKGASEYSSKRRH